jgi:hypothetical protein
MDRTTVQIQTPPQVVTIGLDPALVGLLGGIHATMGLIYAELQEGNRLARETHDLVAADSQARAEWDATTTAIAQALTPVGSPTMAQDALNADPTVSGAYDGAETPGDPLERATDPSTEVIRNGNELGTAAPAVIDLADVWETIKDTWVVASAGGYRIQDPDTGMRKPTLEEQQALERYVNTTRKKR